MSVASIAEAVARMGPEPLTEAGLAAHVHPLFSRVLARPRIYLANHSLGRPLDRTAEDVAEALALWYGSLGQAWDGWHAEMARFRAATARLVGAPRPDCIVPKTSAGQGLRAVLNSFDGPVAVLTTRGEFDSVDFILKHYRDRGRIALGFVEPDAAGFFQPGPIIEAVNALPRPGKGAALLVLSQVMFTTGQVVPALPAIVAAAHARGVLVLLDVYHAAGVLPLDLAALDADFAIGGSYKYLRGGPGACWLYVHARHLAAGRTTLDTGWFAQEEPFAYARSDVPRFAAGGDAWLESTPPVLSSFQARAGLEFTLAVGVPRLREYSLAQQRRLVAALAARRVAALGGEADRGAFVVVRHPGAAQLAAALGNAGIDADARGGWLRLCPDVLTTEEEMVRAAEALAAALGAGG